MIFRVIVYYREKIQNEVTPKRCVGQSIRELSSMEYPLSFGPGVTDIASVPGNTH